MMKIDCISDLHGHYPKLEGGDLLIIAGDLTARDTHSEYLEFYCWLHKQKYKHYIFIAGNHDNLLEKDEVLTHELANTTYLCDSGTEFEGLKIWGSPWTAYFDGMNPHCAAFTINVGCDTDQWLAEKWAMIPGDTDILITHSPPKYIMDVVNRGPYPENTGSQSLCDKLKNMNHRLHVFGHIHEEYGKEELERISDGHKCTYVNASHVDENYKPVNPPIRIIL
jgi:Icc-related predicted phosphoesterase